ncbi:HAMP domain-containing protein [Streptomyces sp. 900105755]|uniref:HAMP domain-containing sensor histidine kinase n=1 Tax=Streptomyces sp. 900105755 TaxID=3154389 RepID=UPI00332A0DB1
MHLLASRTRRTGGVRGVVRRLIVASSLLVLPIGIAFAILLHSAVDLRAVHQLAQNSEEVRIVANQEEQQVLAFDTDLHGYALTGQPQYVKRWQNSVAAFPKEADKLKSLTAHSPGELARAEWIQNMCSAYIKDSSTSLANATGHGLSPRERSVLNGEDNRRFQVILDGLHDLVAGEQTMAKEREAHAATPTDQAVAATIAGLAGFVVTTVGVAGYVIRAIVRPVRRTAAMADQLANGDLTARTPETAIGEIGLLERSFNRMADSLEQGHAELSTSRARILAATDRARRSIERDLHDGTQQRLVALLLEMQVVQSTVPADQQELRARISRAADSLKGVLDDLHELSRGIHPAVLTHGGLAAALRALARRSPVPVELDVDVPRGLPEPVEVAAYYVVSEALTNTSKHAHASCVHVCARTCQGVLRLSVRDDGVGGADTGTGSGLVGLTDRVRALGGMFDLHSPKGRGTTLRAHLPLVAPATVAGERNRVPLS